MNRPIIIFMTAIVAVGIFIAGALIYNTSSKKQVSATSAENETTLVREHAPVIGPADAPVTIVEFFDPACEACRAFYPLIKEILATFEGKVRVVIRYASFHPQSEEAIRLLEAARKQGKFEVVLERILNVQPKWAPHGRSADNLWTLLEDTGLDIERAKLDATHSNINAVLHQDTTDIQTIGVQQTPTFFVNGKPLPSFGAEQLYMLVRDEVINSQN
ncbi:DsbA family protein [Curvivirga sp.]|uniref:DsbA family protein n=1 Tax=Curvivirga sp. TaxID=2856848 RepID=UPI003B5A70C9